MARNYSACRVGKRCSGVCFLLMLAGPALAGPPFITDDPEPVDLGQWEVYGFSAGAAGKGAVSGLGPSMEADYGAATGLQLHVAGGFSYEGRRDGTFVMGISDTELGAKLRLLKSDENEWYPQLGVYPLIEVPTGNARRGLGAGYWQEFLPLWLQKDWGAWSTHGGGGYWINPGPGNRNFWFVGWLLQRHVTDFLELGGEVFHQTSSMEGQRASSGFNLSGMYNFTPHNHLLFALGRGGILYAVDSAVVGYPTTYYIAYQWTS
ncbi:MAG TPA: hypothetical protein VKB67_11865 [Rhizomicrobium sp.]|nr:hypothetical protein [Rhizomicrobium sp.]